MGRGGEGRSDILQQTTWSFHNQAVRSIASEGGDFQRPTLSTGYKSSKGSSMNLNVDIKFIGWCGFYIILFHTL